MLKCKQYLVGGGRKPYIYRVNRKSAQLYSRRYTKGEIGVLNPYYQLLKLILKNEKTEVYCRGTTHTYFNILQL